MLTRPRRADVAVIIGAVALVVLSLRPWWHDSDTQPASTTPWRASTVWSACIVLVAVAAVLAAFVRRAAVRVGAAAVAVGAAVWAVVYTVGLYGIGPRNRGWWGFSDSSNTSPVTIKCGRSCNVLPRFAFARDDLSVTTGVANPTRSAFAGLTVMVLLALGAAWLVWRRVRAQRQGAVG